MATRLIGTDDADPRLPDVVITASGFGTAEAGVVPASGGGTINFLRADGTWTAPAGGGGGVSDGDKGDITVSGTGTSWQLNADTVTTSELADDAVATANIANSAVTNLKLATANAMTLKGNNTGSTAPIVDMTAAQAKTLLAVTKGDVGLGNVDNTGDVAKPVSNAQQTALDLKANKSRTINAYSGTAVTAVIGDAGAYVRCTGTNPTYTIPLNASVAFPVGTQIDGVGTATAMTIAATGGVTVNKARTLVTVAADSGWTAIKVATDEWDVHGDFV